MSNLSYTEPAFKESPLLWPALVLLVLAISAFTYYWNGHRDQFPYSTTNTYNASIWPPPPERAK